MRALAVWWSALSVLAASGTEPKPMGAGDEARLLARLEREWAYREGLSEPEALHRLTDLARFAPTTVRARAFRNRLLFAYP